MSNINVVERPSTANQCKLVRQTTLLLEVKAESAMSTVRVRTALGGIKSISHQVARQLSSSQRRRSDYKELLHRRNFGTSPGTSLQKSM